ncbi:MAG: endolytic transglycosylase MltG [Candidatus Eisenbacteria bacterium]|nr:endolytic transglycosylase MltG [Candidatus Eisenbacteria bacterium]
MNAPRPRPAQAFRPRRWTWLLLLAALLAPAYELFLPAGIRPPNERRIVIIERGKSLRTIAAELQRVGVIRSPFGFLVLARLMRLDRSIKAGQYAFRLGTTVPALLRALDRGMYGLDLVRLPEGLTMAQTFALLAPRLGVPPARLDSLARDPALLDSLGVTSPSLEGWLAPDSYEWLPGTPVESVLRTMVARTRERLRRATAGCDSLPLDFDPPELLTLASIVEAEAQVDDERPHIARVYLNRLVKDMRLQADPTVGYALGRGPRSRLLLRDLKVDSDYNTYLHDGLPPGPVCNPGYRSIEAVVYATPGSRDLYFVARGDGRHMFAQTYAQHLANISAARALQALMASRRALADSAAAVAADSAR